MNQIKYPRTDQVETTIAFGDSTSWQLHQYQKFYDGHLKTQDQYILSGDSLHTAFAYDRLGRQTVNGYDANPLEIQAAAWERAYRGGVLEPGSIEAAIKIEIDAL